MRRAAGTIAVLAAALAVAVAGCGGGGDPRLTVSAASSLKRALTDYGDGFGGAKVRLSFAGSDQLAAQIRAGARPDVYAAANTDLPQGLFRDGLVERPVEFASNSLVVAVPASGGKVRALADLGRPGVRIAVGAASLPVGAYTRKVVAKLPAARRIEANFRDQEPDVSGVVARVARGAVDAGFVYVTDVEGSNGTLGAIELPVDARVVYAAAVVRGSKHREEARRFVRGLAGNGALRKAGFGLPR